MATSRPEDRRAASPSSSKFFTFVAYCILDGVKICPHLKWKGKSMPAVEPKMFVIVSPLWAIYIQVLGVLVGLSDKHVSCLQYLSYCKNCTRLLIPWQQHSHLRLCLLLRSLRLPRNQRLDLLRHTLVHTGEKCFEEESSMKCPLSLWFACDSLHRCDKALWPLVDSYCLDGLASWWVKR